MCKVKSGLVLRNRVYVPDHDSHDLMLKELSIKDDYLGASEKFVRFELSPKDGNLLDDVENWVLKIDQDIVPDWFDVKEKRIDIVNAVRAWAKVHIITSGEHEIEDGVYSLFGDAKATLLGDAQATLRDNAKATLYDNAQATLYDNAQATLWGDAKATLSGDAQATLRDNAKATLYDNAQATLYDNAQATLFGDAKATLFGDAQATLRGDAQATLWCDAKATLSDNAQATLLGDAQATLYDNAKATLRGNAKGSNCKIHDCAIVINHEEHKVWTASKWENEVI